MTKYRQTFTVEFDPDRPVDTCINPGAPEFLQAGRNESASPGTTISWTAPEPIIEVPTGIGAVVVDGSRSVSWVKTFDEDGAPWKGSSGFVRYKSDAEILDLLKAGAEIKSHGVEL